MTQSLMVRSNSLIEAQLSKTEVYQEVMEATSRHVSQSICTDATSHKAQVFGSTSHANSNVVVDPSTATLGIFCE